MAIHQEWRARGRNAFISKCECYVCWECEYVRWMESFSTLCFYWPFGGQKPEKQRKTTVQKKKLKIQRHTRVCAHARTHVSQKCYVWSSLNVQVRQQVHSARALIVSNFFCFFFELPLAPALTLLRNPFVFILDFLCHRYCCCVNAHKMHNVIAITSYTHVHVYTDAVYSNTILIINQNMHAKWTMLWSIHSMDYKHSKNETKWLIRTYYFSSNPPFVPLTCSFLAGKC